MAENSKIAARNPSLKRHFKYMLTNRKISVQFTSDKIKEIIQVDLGIKLDSHDCLYARVSTEAFAYYMQSWPEWRSAAKSTYSEELYERLKTYLREKLIKLKEKEQEIIEKDSVVNFNDKADASVVFRDGKRTKLPHSLKVIIPANILTTQQLCFRQHEKNDLLFEFSEPTSPAVNLNTEDLLNHPFVAVDFKIPGLLHIHRSTPFKIENFIQHADDNSTNKTEFIIAIENAPAKSKVYAFTLIEALFKQLNAVLSKYSSEISDTRRSEILALSEMFLRDVTSTNVRNNTICESATVTYNFGRSVYYSDTVISGNSDDIDNSLVHRKILTPIVTYSLKFCSILQQDVTVDGFKYFNFSKGEDKVLDSVFLVFINTSIKYKCTSCDINFDLKELKLHLNRKHRLDPTLKCAQCNKAYLTSEILQNKWCHVCH